MNWLIPNYNNYNQRAVVHSTDEIARTLIGSGGTGGYHSGNEPKILEVKMGEKIKNLVKNSINKVVKRVYAIRKLTPSECYVLMGMKAEDVDKCRAVGVSDSQLYKQAGNGLTTTHPQFIMEHLYKCLWDKDYVTTDEQMIKDGYGVEE